MDADRVNACLLSLRRSRTYTVLGCAAFVIFAALDSLVDRPEMGWINAATPFLLVPLVIIGAVALHRRGQLTPNGRSQKDLRDVCRKELRRRTLRRHGRLDRLFQLTLTTVWALFTLALSAIMLSKMSHGPRPWWSYLFASVFLLLVVEREVLHSYFAVPRYRRMLADLEASEDSASPAPPTA